MNSGLERHLKIAIITTGTVQVARFCKETTLDGEMSQRLILSEIALFFK